MIDSICAFGDSIVKGVIFDTIRGRYTYLKNSFANLFVNHTGIKVDNYAKFGCMNQSYPSITTRYWSLAEMIVISTGRKYPRGQTICIFPKPRL